MDEEVKPGLYLIKGDDILYKSQCITLSFIKFTSCQERERGNFTCDATESECPRFG